MPITISLTWTKIWSILGFLATFATVTTYLTWEIRKDYIEELKNQISMYTQADAWKLPDTLKKLKDTSEKLQSQLEADEKIKELTLEVTRLELANSATSSSLREEISKSNTLSIQIISLNQELKKSLSEYSKFNLKEGQTAELVKNRVNFGLSSISSGMIRGYINNESITLKIAGFAPIKVGSETCTLTLLQAEYPLATISFGCTSSA